MAKEGRGQKEESIKGRANEGRKGEERGGKGRGIQNTVVQLIELQRNRGGTGKSRQNSRGTGIAKLTGAAPPWKKPRLG